MKKVKLKFRLLSLMLSLFILTPSAVFAQSQTNQTPPPTSKDDHLTKYVQLVNERCKIYWEGSSMTCSLGGTDFHSLAEFLDSAPPELCKYVNAKIQDECFYEHVDLARHTNPVSICNSADDTNIRDKCLYIAGTRSNQRNVIICNEISDNELRKDCRARAAYEQVSDLKSTPAILATIGFILVFLIAFLFVLRARYRTEESAKQKVSRWLAPIIAAMIHIIVARVLYPLIVVDLGTKFVFRGLRVFDLFLDPLMGLRQYFAYDWPYRVLVDLIVVASILILMSFVLKTRPMWTWRRAIIIFSIIYLILSGGVIALCFVGLALLAAG